MSESFREAEERPEGALRRQARALLAEAVEQERDGKTRQAERGYLEVVERARSVGARDIEADAFRRLAVLRHHQGKPDDARDCCLKSLALAEAVADPVGQANSLNVLANLSLASGQLDDARRLFDDARRFATSRDELLAKIEQNLGIVANVAGDFRMAEKHYLRALEAYRRLGDEQGLAVAFHNLGMISADHENHRRAEEYFDQALMLARRVGDLRLQGLCRLNRAECFLATQRYDAAWDEAEAAQAVFSQIGSVVEEADVYRLLGALFRQIGRLGMSEANLLAAIHHAATTGSRLTEAESLRELALLRIDQAREPEALQVLERAALIFGEIGAGFDLADTQTRIAALR